MNEVFTDDSEMAYPQSGEIILGRANRQAVYTAFPNLPSIAPYRTIASGDIVVCEAVLDYAVFDAKRAGFGKFVFVIRRSIEQDQNNGPAHLWLAQCLVLSRVEGDNARNKQLQEEACGEYKKVLRLQPSNQDAKKGMDRIGCK